MHHAPAGGLPRRSHLAADVSPAARCIRAAAWDTFARRGVDAGRRRPGEPPSAWPNRRQAPRGIRRPDGGSGLETIRCAKDPVSCMGAVSPMVTGTNVKRLDVTPLRWQARERGPPAVLHPRWHPRHPQGRRDPARHGDLTGTIRPKNGTWTWDHPKPPGSQRIPHALAGTILLDRSCLLDLLRNHFPPH